MTLKSPALNNLTSQRLRIAYAEWGNTRAPKVVLVHGGRDQKRSWDWLASRLCERFHVIAHDLRGHGESDWVSDGDYGVMDHVFDLATVMDTLAPDPAIVIGHSLGGNIALRYAGLFPARVSKLVAIEGLGPSPRMLADREAEPIDQRLRAWIDNRRDLSARQARSMPDIAAASARMHAAFSHLRSDQIHHLTQTGVRRNDDGSVSWAYDPAGMGRSPADITPETYRLLWSRITCPTWLVYGADSWASNPQLDGRAAHFANARVDVIANAGHWVHHDQFDLFMDGLTSFLTA